MRVTSTGTWASCSAAPSPPKPAPTITTCGYLLISTYLRSSSSDCITCPPSDEILVAVDITRFSIRTSCSCVRGPSRRRASREFCARNVAWVTRWNLFGPSLATCKTSELLPTEGTLKLTDGSPPLFTRLYYPALYNHLSC